MVAAPNVFTRWIASWRTKTIKSIEGILEIVGSWKLKPRCEFRLGSQVSRSWYLFSQTSELKVGETRPKRLPSSVHAFSHKATSRTSKQSQSRPHNMPSSTPTL
jgi:hypothetical protein